MLRSKRIQLIRDYVIKNGTVSIDDLVSEFNVSKNTIRRDIHVLVESGELKKVYGGVEVNTEKEHLNPAELVNEVMMDDEMAESAAHFVEDGDIIFIDSEYPTSHMVNFLHTKQITVITNSMEFMIKALPYENLHVISLGGILNRKTKSFTVINTRDFLKDININKAFFSPEGISLRKGVTHSSPLENDFKQAIIAKSGEVFLVADYYRFDKSALMTFCNLDEVDYIITDYAPDEKYIEFAKENGIHFVIANE